MTNLTRILFFFLVLSFLFYQKQTDENSQTPIVKNIYQKFKLHVKVTREFTIGEIWHHLSTRITGYESEIKNIRHNGKNQIFKKSQWALCTRFMSKKKFS